MKIMYIAGCFRAENAWLIEQNVRAAELVGFEVAKLGAMPLIPHANSRFFQGALPDDFWLEGTLELLRRCDALMLVEGWEKSSGARREVVEAWRLDKPVFDELSQLKRWISGDAAYALAHSLTTKKFQEIVETVSVAEIVAKCFEPYRRAVMMVRGT